jgi:hypothetical protein
MFSLASCVQGRRCTVSWCHHPLCIIVFGLQNPTSLQFQNFTNLISEKCLCNDVLINLAQSIIKFYKLRELGTSLQGQMYRWDLLWFCWQLLSAKPYFGIIYNSQVANWYRGEDAAVRAAIPSLGTDGGAWGSRCNVLIDELMVESEVQGVMSWPVLRQVYALDISAR